MFPTHKIMIYIFFLRVTIRSTTFSKYPYMTNSYSHLLLEFLILHNKVLKKVASLVDTLSANPTKWTKTLTQFVGCFFLTAIRLSHGQLVAIIKGTASFTQC